LIQPGEVDWKKVLSRAKLLHVSGITPALSTSAAETTAVAMKAAKEAGCLVSYDLNYRKKLWSPAEAKSCQEPLMKLVDILTTTEEDTGVVFGIREDTYQKVAESLAKAFGFKAVAITLREDISVWKNNWTAIAYADGKIYSDRTYTVEIVDRVGGGDRFSSAIIYALLNDWPAGKANEFAAAYSALAHTFPGDINWATYDEAVKAMAGGGARISR
jgi:2-dehydro-3-deoxygluconokinase